MHDREAKRTLPRPKVGDFCSNAMEQGYSDACVALCTGERPVPRVAQTCRAAAIEMPRPTVRRWCEHGYNTAFQKTIKDLRSHFNKKPADEVPPAAETMRTNQREEQPARTTTQAAKETTSESKAATAQREASLRGNTASQAIKATIPITIGEETKNLVVLEGQNAEDAVVAFCRENVPDDVSSCIRQLLSTVIEKLEEGAGN